MIARFRFAFTAPLAFPFASHKGTAPTAKVALQVPIPKKATVAASSNKFKAPPPKPVHAAHRHDRSQAAAPSVADVRPANRPTNHPKPSSALAGAKALARQHRPTNQSKPKMSTTKMSTTRIQSA